MLLGCARTIARVYQFEGKAGKRRSTSIIREEIVIKPMFKNRELKKLPF